MAVQTSHKGRYCGLWQRCHASYRKTLGIFQAKIRWSLQAKHTSRQVVRPVCSLLESVGVRVEIQWGGALHGLMALSDAQLCYEYRGGLTNIQLRCRAPSQVGNPIQRAPTDLS